MATDILNADVAGMTVQQRFAAFLMDYESQDLNTTTQSNNDQTGGSLKSGGFKEYRAQLKLMREREQNTMHVDFAHLQSFDVVLAQAVADEHYRFEPFLRRAVQVMVEALEKDYLRDEGEMREFSVAFYNTGEVRRVRDLSMSNVGKLTSFCGTITRTSEVRPELLTGRFSCGACGMLSSPVEQQFKLTEPALCVHNGCGNTKLWKLESQRSRFGDWQRIRVQENADEIPPGSLPRSVDVILRHAAVDRAKAGDRCFFTGQLVVVPDVGQLYKPGAANVSSSRGSNRGGMGSGEGITGLKALGVRDMTYKTAFIAQSVAHGRPDRVDGGDEEERARAAGPEAPPGALSLDFTPEDVAEFQAMADSGQIYADIIRSIAPTISGHDEVKKGLLLMLLGGVHKSRPDEKLKLRGDLNVCIVGDPSTAKSQFLKYVCRFAPRAVYTSGKASSAAGLTASVVRDPDSGEFVVEAGALMLADNGICCIDEFDKMDPGDQVAIHEAMEQQTISITKAGIQATLNARTSVLAAANPVFGRYDRTKTLRQNVNISAPIMSRFDLFYVILDELDEGRDSEIASHIIRVHATKRASEEDVPYDMDKVRAYVRFARTLMPQLSDGAKRSIAHAYKLLRASDSLNHAGSSYRVTVRQLESLVRLSEALARLHLDRTVSAKYVNEAYRLIKSSMARADGGGDVELDLGGEFGDDAIQEEEEEGGEEGMGGDGDEFGLGPAPGDGGGGDDDEDGGDDGAPGGGAGASSSSNSGAGGQQTPSRASQAGSKGARTPGSARGQGADSSASAAAPAAAGGRKKKAKAAAATKISMSQYRARENFFALRLRTQERADLSQPSSAGGAGASPGADGGSSDDNSALSRQLRGALTFGDLVASWVASRGASTPYVDEAEREAEARLSRLVLRMLLRSSSKGHSDFYYVNHTESSDAPSAVEDIPEEQRFVALAADYAIPGVATTDA